MEVYDHGMKDRAEGFGHGGSDFYSMYFFIQKILGDESADTIDVYAYMAQLWAEECAKTEGTYRSAALSQGSK